MICRLLHWLCRVFNCPPQTYDAPAAIGAITAPDSQ